MSQPSSAVPSARKQSPQVGTRQAASHAVPLDLDAYKGCNSVQILHALQMEKKREYAQLSAISATSKTRVHGAGLAALVNASAGGAQLDALDTLQSAIAGSAAGRHSGSDSVVRLSERAAPRQGRAQTVITQQVVAAVHQEILEKRRGSPSPPGGSPTSSPQRSSPPLPRAGSPKANSPSPTSARQRELQKQMWIKIGHGQAPSITKAPPSPTHRDANRGEQGTRDSSRSPTSPLLRLASPGKAGMGDSTTSFMQRSGSMASSIGSPLRAASRGSARFFEGSFAGSTRRSPSMRRSFFRDMPTPEDVQSAYDTTKKRLAKEPLRRATALITPIQARPQQHLLSLRASLQQLDLERDNKYGLRRTAIAHELDSTLINSILGCRVACEVSPLDAPLQKMFNAAVQHFTPPPSTDMEGAEEDTRMRLRATWAEGTLRWAALSFDHLPRGSVSVAVASDAVCDGFVEFPGTGRAGAALFSPVVLGSRGDNLQHDALHTMCLEGMMGLESIGRIVLQFHGPQLLEREHMCFTESIHRSALAQMWFEELAHEIVREWKQLRAHKRRRVVGLGATATLRQSHDGTSPQGAGASATGVNAAYFQFLQSSLAVMLDSMQQRRGMIRTALVLRLWCERGRLSMTQKSLRSSIATEVQMISLAKLAKHRRAEAFASRLHTQNLRSVFHVFFVACQRRKQQRHVMCIRATDELLQGNKGRKEVMAATAAKEQASRLVASLTAFAHAQLRSQTPGSPEVHLPITLTGHSTGGAVALLAACMINANNDNTLSVRRVITFGAPKVFVEDATAILQSLSVIHIAVALEKDPAVHQPWTFDPTGTGCFVAVDTDGATSSPVAASTMAVRTVRPCPWGDFKVTPSAAKSHWLTYHSIDAYVKAFAPSAFHAIKRITAPPPLHEPKEGSKTKKLEDLDAARREEQLEFETQVLHPMPARGASHGFSPAAMRCLQHIVTRYGVGNQQRVPRDLLLATLGSTSPMKRFSIHLYAERVPVGHGGRIDQASYILWLWHETVLEPAFLSSFLTAFHYEYSGKDFFPRQKALITPPPPPKILPVTALCQTDRELSLTTIGRTAVHALFRTYSRVFPPSPFEVRLAPETPLMSKFCIQQVLTLGRWSHRCSPADAVDCIFQWVSQEHQADFTGKRAQVSVHDRLSTLGKSGRPDDAIAVKQCLMSYSGELTECGVQRFVQLFVCHFGLIPLQNALWALGFSRQWEIVVSQVTNIECDIHWAYGPCRCLAVAAERRVVNAEEESYLRKEISVLAAEITANRRRLANGSQQPTSNITLSIPAICDAMSNSTTTSARPSPTANPMHDERLMASVRSPGRTSPQEASIRRSFAEEAPVWDISGIPKHDGLAEHTLADVSRWSAPAQPEHNRVRRLQQLSTTLYTTDAGLGDQWTSLGNGKRLQRDARKLARTYVHELRSRSGTSVGAKPRRCPTREQREDLRSSLRNPSTNTLGGLSTMYGPTNMLRLINPTQRQVMRLPPLRNVLLEGPGTTDPNLEHDDVE